MTPWCYRSTPAEPCTEPVRYVAELTTHGPAWPVLLCSLHAQAARADRKVTRIRSAPRDNPAMAS